MAPDSLFSRLKARIARHRAAFGDGFFICATLLVATFLFFEFHVFHTEARASLQKERLELNEIMALAALFCVSLVFYAGRRLLEQKKELTRRIEAEREARVLALEDPLTGLPNRRRFDECLNNALAALPGAQSVHAVLLLDLNGFKRINDVFGHADGDDVLSVVGQRLNGLVREGDVVARLGGDEFALLAQHMSGPEAAAGLALRIIEALSAPVRVGNVEHAVGVGIGIALAPRDATTVAEILRKADIALYRAKSESGSAMRFFEAQMDAQVRERSLMERELRKAIANGDLFVQYQPQMDLKTGHAVGFEALARWTHETLGEIPPDRFIPIAEDCGMIRELTGKLLRQACRDARAWPKEVTLSFNISPVELKDRTLGLRIMSILAETGLAPNRLEVEITESALVRDMDAAKDVLGALRDAGVRIALDDFGTGYSSLYHLRNFKLDKIKIDRSFISAMMEQPESAAIVRALLGLGRGLGLTVTAEGVESAGQQAALADQGCDQAQGFLFSEAVSAEHTLALLGRAEAPVRRKSAKRL